MILSRSILKMRNASGKSCRENRNTFHVQQLFPENRAVYEIMWKNYGTAGQATDDNITRRMRFACWITKATDTHSECVILKDSPRQKLLRERR
jgi:hypothetical protein